MTKRVLVIEDDLAFARSICAYLARHNYEVDSANTGDKGLSHYRKNRPDVTMLDYQLGKINGLEILHGIRRVDDDARVVMMTGHGDIKLAVDAMKFGACDFLTKPLPLRTIKGVVDQLTNSNPHATPLQLVRSGLDAICGRSAAINELKHAVKQILAGAKKLDNKPPPVLISGETGTGKELIARALHSDGPRRDKKFLRVDCAALSCDEIEQLLFKCQNGAIRNSTETRRTLLQEANGGVLFLDEISALSASLQAKLVRFLENNVFEVSRTNQERNIDIWVVSATNRSLAALTQSRMFSKHLLFRLQALWLEAPALRHRDSDMLYLAELFLTENVRRYGHPQRTLTSDARAKLVNHSWPGNVRELRNVIERASLVATGEEINAQDIVFSESVKLTEEALVTLPEKGVQLFNVEHNLLNQALERTCWNVSKAASLLGLSRDQMRYRIAKFGLDRNPKETNSLD